MPSITFGPIQSRRFGISLGVDLSPYKKQCNFDCVYCELQPVKAPESKTTSKFSEILPLDELLDSVKQSLKQHEEIDVLTITANGEPTLYPYLKEFIVGIKPYIPKKTKSLILSNGSLFGDKNIQEALKEFDIVKFSLDSVLQSSFKKIDRAHKGLMIDDIKDGIKSYANIRKNILICEVLVVKNINDNDKDMKLIADFLREIKVDRIDLGTIDRPPAYNVKAVDYDKLIELSKIFDGLFISLPQRKNINIEKLINLDDKEILNLLQRRPIAINEIENLFSKNSIERFQKLFNNGIIKIKNTGLIDFYTL